MKPGPESSPTRVKLTVEVPFDGCKPAVEAATATKIADQVQIPGFRKGKVPAKLVEQRFGRPAIVQERPSTDALPDFLAGGPRPRPRSSPSAAPRSRSTVPTGLDSRGGKPPLHRRAGRAPEIALPDFSAYEVEIEEPEVDEDAVEVASFPSCANASAPWWAWTVPPPTVTSSPST